MQVNSSSPKRSDCSNEQKTVGNHVDACAGQFAVPSSSFRNIAVRGDKLATNTSIAAKVDNRTISADDAIFVLDEDMMKNVLEDNRIEYYTNDFENNSDNSSDEAIESSRQNKINVISSRLHAKCIKNTQRSKHGGCLSSDFIAASLPVTISRGLCARNDSFANADSDEDDLADKSEDDLDGSHLPRPRAKTILSSREDEMYRNMQAYSRSIQPADDPERLFGERPHRRYRPTEQSADGSDKSTCDDRFVSSSLRNTVFRGGCSMAAVPITPIIANDLNLITAGGMGNTGNTTNANNNNASRSRVVVPASLSTGHFF